MAIKISGSTIIDDSRNIVNAGVVTATSFSGDGTSLTGVGASVTNLIYVTKDGNDSNSGLKITDAKATIKAAVGIAQSSSVIKVSAGNYIENNPIELPSQISIIGDSLREVSVTPQNANQDLIYVSPGDYISDISFTGSLNSGKAVFAFNPSKPRYSIQSPYIRNCTNFINNSIGMKIDGNHVIGPYKSMVTDSYTQYNANGIGVSITNEGYAQLVSIFTINPDISIFTGSGGMCDLTNSNSSFGNFGLVSDGVGPRKFTGIVTAAASANSSEFKLDLSVPTFNVSNFEYDNTTGLTTVTTSSNHNFTVGMGVTLANIVLSCAYGNKTYPDGDVGFVFEVKSLPASNKFTTHVGISTLAHSYVSGGTAKTKVVRPFDGQVVYFDELYQSVGKITVTNGGSGYTSAPTVTIASPSQSWGINATAIAIIENGSISEITIVSEGRGYTSTPSISFSGGGGSSAAASLVMAPQYFVVEKSTPISSGVSTVTFTENVPFAVGVGSTVPFFKQSRILASSHSFEYIGSGTDLINSLPSRGGVTIQENEIDDRNGGLTIFTSTDQAGNFRIGDGVVINQQAGTVTGDSYTKSLFSTMTPFILALGGD
tara:strand:+ start:3258 stop:5057 length:1800 start_codon:yes stop_codon:yes gene_type:complete